MYIDKDKKKKDRKSNYRRILRLTDNYLDKGHIIFFDNFYTSIEIVDYLYQRNTGCMGILRQGRVLQKDLDINMKKGDLRCFQHITHKHIILTYWWDSIVVKALSTCFPIRMEYSLLTSKNEYKEYPACFKEYNKKAHAIDINNSMISLYWRPLRSSRYWLYIFIYHLQISVKNTYLIYKSYQLNKLGIKRKKGTYYELMPRKRFSLYIIKKLLMENGPPKLDNKDKYFNNFNKACKRKMYKDDEILPHAPRRATMVKATDKPTGKKCSYTIAAFVAMKDCVIMT